MLARVRLRAIIAGLIVSTAAGCASIRPAVNESAVDDIMRAYAGNDRPGASVLVFRDGAVLFRKSYGMADLERGLAATPATNYRLASVTKQFTAAAILRLAERGALSLDDRVRHHLPSLPEEVDAVTIRHVLTHTSGLIDYEDVIPDGTTEQLLDRDVLRLLEPQRQTYFAPGTSYRYSNSGYALLALIVEKTSGRSFAEFLDREIFEPLRMSGTVAHQEGVSVVANRAFGHTRDGDGWRRTDQSITSAVLGDGGVYSSIDDLARWLAALDDGAFAEAVVPRVVTTDQGVEYGYGWRVGERDGRPVVWHTGETIGFRNALVRFPVEHLAVVVLTNRNEGTPVDLAWSIAETLLR